MTSGMIVRTVFETILVGFTLWALFHEDFFAAFEHKLISTIKRKKFKVVGCRADIHTI